MLNERAETKGGKSVLVKEPSIPKLVQGQKYEDWLKQVDDWLKEMEKCWAHDRADLGPYSVRLMKDMFKECKNEEVKEYAVKYIVSNNECKTFEQIKKKLKLRFGKTEKQEDKEVRKYWRIC